MPSKTRRWFLVIAFLAVITHPLRAAVRDFGYLGDGNGWLWSDRGVLARAEGSWQSAGPRDYPANAIVAVTFADPRHGWILFSLAPVGGFEIARTNDGGITWLHTPIALANDDAESYRQADLAALDAEHVWLLVRIPTGSAFSLARLFVTSDGGGHWDEMPAPPAYGRLRAVPEGTVWLTGGAALNRLWSSPDAGRTWTEASPSPLRGALADAPVVAEQPLDSPPSRSIIEGVTTTEKTDFRTPEEGWLVRYERHCDATACTDADFVWQRQQNGWQDITPADETPLVTPRERVMAARVPGSIARYSSGYGFDTSQQGQLSVSQMQSVFGTSFSVTFGSRTYPGTYANMGVYIGGSDVGATPPSASWLQQVSAQGWGFLPLWVPLQAPCTTFAHRLSYSDDPVAKGNSEGSLAVTTARNLGFSSGAVIWVDIEAFVNNSSFPNCGSTDQVLMKRYVNAIFGRLRNNGFHAGLYTSASNGAFWTTVDSNLTSAPDDLWLAAWGRALFDMSGFMPSGWYQGSRAHQFANVGSSPSLYGLGADYDASDGPVETVGSVSAPSNDNCSGAIQLTSSTSCNFTSGTVFGATPSGLSKPGCDSATSPDMDDVWYKFTAVASTQTITVDPVTSLLDPVVSLYNSCGGSPIACMDNGADGVTETLTATGLSVGSTYYIRIYDWGTVEPPAGDAGFQICVTGTPVTNSTLTVQGGGNGQGTVTGNSINCSINNGSTSGTCSVSIPSNSPVTLNESASGGSSFNGWSSPCGSGSSCSFTITGNTVIQASFSAAVTTGTINVNATLNGSPWTGNVSYQLSGAATLNGASVPSTFSSVPSGTYTLSYQSGGPGGSPSISNATQTLSGGGNVTFTLAFTSSGQPDLLPYQLPGWDDKIVVSKTPGTNTNDTISPGDTIYVDFALANLGGASATSTFYTDLLVDGTVVGTWYTPPPLDPNGAAYVVDFVLGSLPAGPHTITINVDSTNVIAESNESNNTYSRTFTVGRGALHDFNGDRKSDLVWRNAGTGDTVIWLMNGLTSASASYLVSLPSPWVVAGAGDYDGDGKSDVIWRNTATGDTVMWLMNGATYSSSRYLTNLSSAWSIAANGDFDGDGKTDIIWRNSTTGDTVIWFMSGTGYTSSRYLVNLPGSWKIAATGDFDGDGKTDVIWRNDSTGDTVMWLMNGASYTGRYLVNLASSWSIGAAGDFDGDGRSDIVWRNSATGDTVMWLMTGTGYSAGYYLVNLPSAWSIASSGDLDGDGKCDLIWRNSTTGDTVAWLMNGPANTSAHSLINLPPSWSIVTR